MTHHAAFANGFALSAALIVAVGAQNTFVLRQGLRREHVATVVLFCALADLALMAAGVAGLGSVLGRVPGLTTALSLVGVGFLGWYGLAALRRALSPGALIAASEPGAMSRAAVAWRAAGFTLLNPHVYLDTVMLVGLVGAAEPAGAQPAFVAGAGSARLAWFATLGFGARLLSPVFARPAAWRVLDAIVAATMLALAARLALGALG